MHLVSYFLRDAKVMAHFSQSDGSFCIKLTYKSLHDEFCVTAAHTPSHQGK